MVALYRSGVSTASIAKMTGLSLWKVRHHLEVRGVAFRPPGRPRVSREEVERRKAVALTCDSWEEYGAKVGVANPKLDRRLGVRLRCFMCKKRPSVGSAHIGDPTGATRPVCGVCKRKRVVKAFKA